MITDRQLVARVFRGQLDKPARDLSASYVRRLARGIRAARAEGRKPSRQAARGHTPRLTGGVLVTTEHPKAYVRQGGAYLRPGDAKPAAIRVSSADRHVAGHGVIVNRDFVSRYQAWRYLARLPRDTPVQAIGHGELQPEPKSGSARAKAALNPEIDDDDEPDDEPQPQWRTFYTGNAQGDADENGSSADTYAAFRDAEELIFLPGSVDLYIIRRQD